MGPQLEVLDGAKAPRPARNDPLPENAAMNEFGESIALMPAGPGEWSGRADPTREASTQLEWFR